MTASAAPFGFRASRHPSGHIQARPYTIASAYAVNLFEGDPVKLVAAGTIQLATSDGTRTGTTDTVDVLGVLAGVEYVDSNGKPNESNYWPSGTVATQIIAWVYDDPLIEYTVQADGSIAATAIGDQADFVGFTAPGGSTQTGRSAAALDATLVGAGAQGQFRIIQFDDSLDNEAGDAFTKVIVQIAEHTYRAEKVAV